MNTQTTDRQTLKEAQRQDWNAVASGWEKWWQTIEDSANHVSQQIINMAFIQDGHRILDIATGIGEPAISIARRFDDRTQIVASDQAADMLAIARNRAAELQIGNIHFTELDGETLDLDNDSLFDAVVCRWGLMFMPDVDAALQRIHQLLNRGGRFATAVWSTPDKAPSISFAMNFVRQLLDLPPPPVDAPNPFILADIDALSQRMADAGFDDIQHHRMAVTFAMPSAEAYTAFTRDIAAPVVTMVEKHGGERQEEIWTALTEAVKQFATDDGRICIENETICIAATRY